MVETHARSGAREAADARAAATFIDALVILASLGFVGPAHDAATAAGFPWWAILGIDVALWILIAVAILAACEASRLSATPGKLLCGLRVVTVDGHGITFRKAFMRNLVKYGMSAWGVISLARRDWVDDGAIHDRLVGAMVTRRRRIGDERP